MFFLFFSRLFLYIIFIFFGRANVLYFFPFFSLLKIVVENMLLRVCHHIPYTKEWFNEHFSKLLSGKECIVVQSKMKPRANSSQQTQKKKNKRKLLHVSLLLSSFLPFYFNNKCLLYMASWIFFLCFIFEKLWRCGGKKGGEWNWDAIEQSIYKMFINCFHHHHFGSLLHRRRDARLDQQQKHNL